MLGRVVHVLIISLRERELSFYNCSLCSRKKKCVFLFIVAHNSAKEKEKTKQNNVLNIVLTGLMKIKFKVQNFPAISTK